MTKGEIVENAFTEIGMASYVYQLQAEDIAFGLQLLEYVILFLDSEGIELNWPLADDPFKVDPQEQVNLPPYSISGVTAQLAIDLCSGYGKSPNPATVMRAARGFNSMISVGAMPGRIALNHAVPLGSGNKYWRMYRTFVHADRPRRIDITPNGNIANNGVSH